MSNPNLRHYEVKARSTEIFGRVLCTARNHHFIVDGPEQNDCPGEETTPPELFLAGVAACGVELLQVLARQEDVSLQGVSISVEGIMDRDNPVRPDVSLFNSVGLHFRLKGISEEQGSQLVEAFKAR